MELHVVGGFLGSGKTPRSSVAEDPDAQGRRAGVVTMIRAVRG